MNSQARPLLSKFLTLVLATNSLIGSSPLLTTASAQQQRQQDEKSRNKIIVINAEQPNVWTLEQAHYLPAQMRQRNEFNDANRVTNSLLRRNQNFNSSRRPALLTRRDALSDKSAHLMDEIKCYNWYPH